MSETSLARHCAFCLKEIVGVDIKKCGGCLRRAYCSKECQKTDWKPTGVGQGHKDWCALRCGEEDLDWYVTEVPGKGLGVIAKRTIPPLFRIMVDCNRRIDFPAVEDLMPHGGTLQQKYALNNLGNTDETSSLCLRISRVNHSCRGNAAHRWDVTYRVKVLFSEKEIQEGEEICFAYQPFEDFSENICFADIRGNLALNWGITCPSSCLCHDKEAEKRVQECIRLHKQIASLGWTKSTSMAMECVATLLKYEDELGHSWLTKVSTMHDGFQVGIMQKETSEQGVAYIRKCCEIMKQIVHPQSEKCLTYESYAENPESHMNHFNAGWRNQAMALQTLRQHFH